MRLEEAIKMKAIPDVHLKALLELIYTASEIRNLQTKFFNKYGLSPEQYNILRILRGSYPKSLTMHSIKERMVDRTPHTTRMIDKLEKNLLVFRERSLTDRRKIFIHITEKGLGLMKVIDEALPEFMSIMKKLNFDEAEMLSILLEKLRS